MAVLAVIPARFASTRLPGKPLLRETGKFLIQHVVERVAQAQSLDDVVVATDDARIVAAVESFGGKAVMTSAACQSGTDRVAKVARARPEAEILVNVQGDEPDLDPAVIDAAVARMRAEDRPNLVTLASLCDGAEAQTLRANPNAVKVVCDASGRALYFSRAPLPWDRDADAAGSGTCLRHIGLYAYRREALLLFAGWPPTPLEQREKLEQLRALEHGLSIAVVTVPDQGIGIDTPADYAAFVARVRSEPRS